jgi:hypothetical protein
MFRKDYCVDFTGGFDWPQRCSPAVSQKDLAGRLAARGVNLDRSASSRIESRSRYIMDYEIAAIARSPKVSGGWLFGEFEHSGNAVSRASRLLCRSLLRQKTAMVTNYAPGEQMRRDLGDRIKSLPCSAPLRVGMDQWRTWACVGG